jgi:hypothetical protein
MCNVCLMYKGETSYLCYSVSLYISMLVSWLDNDSSSGSKIDAAKCVGCAVKIDRCDKCLSINNQHYALDYITSLFNMQAPTCFGSRFPSSGSFLDPWAAQRSKSQHPGTQATQHLHYMTDHIVVLLFK